MSFIDPEGDRWTWGLWMKLANLNFEHEIEPGKAKQSLSHVHMYPFGDIKHIPDSCDGSSGFLFIVRSSSTICPISKNHIVFLLIYLLCFLKSSA